eukprot:12912958-Prorocentrum_lima.AAC.1
MARRIHTLFKKQCEPTRDERHARTHADPVAPWAQVFCCFPSSLTPATACPKELLVALPRALREDFHADRS